MSVRSEVVYVAVVFPTVDDKVVVIVPDFTIMAQASNKEDALAGVKLLVEEYIAISNKRGNKLPTVTPQPVIEGKWNIENAEFISLSFRV